MSTPSAVDQFERLLDTLSAAADGSAPWRPALESLLLLARVAGPGDEPLVAAALRHASRALALNARPGSATRRATAPEAAC